jgi:SAM-dependent methyltransferase
MITRPAQKILEIGCGNGFLSLELARDGHNITGLDLSLEILEVAERTSAANAQQSGFGELNYLCTNFETWQAPRSNFDIVIFNRVLHHLTDLEATLAKVKHLLRSNGQIICQDYAYDRFNHQTATWMYQMQRQLFINGLYDENPASSTNDSRAVDVLRKAWHRRGREHHLKGYEEMSLALQNAFYEHFFTWTPYLFVYIGNGIRNTTPTQEQELLTFIKNMEQHMIEQDYMQSVSFRFAGIA